MILADTTVWVDHFRSRSDGLARLIEDDSLLLHPYVIAELDLGFLPRRQETLRLLDALPSATVATLREVRVLIQVHALHGRGIGFVDAHLLASARIHPDCALWTRDERLMSVAGQLGVLADLP